MGAIRIEYVSFSYDDALGARPAETAELTLDDISLEIPDGQFLCLIGHSGSGKTTLLRLLAGLNRPREGRILIDGVPVKGPGLDRAVVFQNYALFPWMTARGNVEFGIQQANKEFGRGLSKAQVKELATELSLIHI